MCRNLVLRPAAPNDLADAPVQFLLPAALLAMDMPVPQIDDEAIVPFRCRQRAGAFDPGDAHAIVLEFNEWLYRHSVTLAVRLIKSESITTRPSDAAASDRARPRRGREAVRPVRGGQ